MGWTERQRTTQNTICDRCFSRLDNIRAPGWCKKGTNFVCGEGSCLEPAVRKRERSWGVSRWQGTPPRPEGLLVGQWKISWSARTCGFDSLVLTHSHLLSFGVK